MRDERKPVEAVPMWESVTVAIGLAIAQGKPHCELQPPTGMESAEPAVLVRWLAQMQTDFPVIPLKLPEPVQTFGIHNLAHHAAGLDFAAQHYRTEAERVAEPIRVLQGTARNGQTLHAALDAFAAHLLATKLLPDKRPSPTARLWCRQVEQLKVHHADTPLSRFGLSEVEGMVTHWQNRPTMKRTGEPAAPDTVRDVIKRIRMFVKWLHKSPAFDWRKPADLEFERVRIRLTPAELSARAVPDQVDTYSVEELATLWAYASPYERFFMVLGLNCGFGQAEILTLQKGDVQRENKKDKEGPFRYIRRARFKTGVYAEWNLWPETQAAVAWMLARHVEDKETSGVVVTKDGTPVPYLTAGSNRNMVIANAWKCLTERIRKDQPAFRPLSFNKLKKTGTDMVRALAGHETAMMYVAHGETGPDELLDRYSNKPFGKVFEAVARMRESLASVFTVADPFPTDAKRSNPALSRGTIRRMVDMRAQGFTLKGIAKEVGCNRATVAYWLNREKAGK